MQAESITSVEHKQLYAHLQYQDAQKINILIKFANEKELIRWVTCIKFAIMIENSRKK